MEAAILQVLKDIHQSYEAQVGLKLDYFEISLSDVLGEMKLSNVSKEFYEALKSLEMEGLITDQSYANGGFGRNVGTDGDVACSLGAKIKLCDF